MAIADEVVRRLILYAISCCQEKADFKSIAQFVKRICWNREIPADEKIKEQLDYFVLKDVVLFDKDKYSIN